jgi:hypothetical protein
MAPKGSFAPEGGQDADAPMVGSLQEYARAATMQL